MRHFAARCGMHRMSKRSGQGDPVPEFSSARLLGELMQDQRSSYLKSDVTAKLPLAAIGI
jgi:hypothetical protein